MTTFYCIRHGKTVFNQNFVLQGGLSNSPLLAEGLEYAKNAGDYLKHINFDEILVSPQKRAQETAQAILSTYSLEPQTYQTIEDLREIEFGDWDGLPQAQFEDFEQFKHLVERPDLYDPSDFNGESFQQLVDRTVPIFNEYTEQFPDGNILVVSHGLTLLSTMGYLTGVEIRDLRKQPFLDNVSISTVLAEPSDLTYSIERWNNTDHY